MSTSKPPLGVGYLRGRSLIPDGCRAEPPGPVGSQLRGSVPSHFGTLIRVDVGGDRLPVKPMDSLPQPHWTLI